MTSRQRAPLQQGRQHAHSAHDRRPGTGNGRMTAAARPRRPSPARPLPVRRRRVLRPSPLHEFPLLVRVRRHGQAGGHVSHLGLGVRHGAWQLAAVHHAGDAAGQRVDAGARGRCADGGAGGRAAVCGHGVRDRPGGDEWDGCRHGEHLGVSQSGEWRRADGRHHGHLRHRAPGCGDRPFGEDTAPLTGDPNRFAGKQLDAATALHYFDARYYRQTWGRFTQVDPLHVGAAMTDPQRWNRYAYAGNNPLRWTDPSGLLKEPRPTPTFRSGVNGCEDFPSFCFGGGGGVPIEEYCRFFTICSGDGFGDFRPRLPRPIPRPPNPSWPGGPGANPAPPAPPGPPPPQPPGPTPKPAPEPDGEPGPTPPKGCKPMPYVDRYLMHVNAFTINVGKLLPTVAGGVMPKTWAPKTKGRPAALGSQNNLTSTVRGIFSGAWTRTPFVRHSSATIGVGTMMIGMYNFGVFTSGIGSCSLSWL